VGEWVSGIGAFLAVVVALGIAWTERRHRLAAERHARELAQRARASQLTIKRETSLLRDQDGVFVRTTAECSFADVEVTYTTSDGEEVRQSLGVIRSAPAGRTIGPKTRVPDGIRSFAVEYTDVDGVRWRQDQSGRLERTGPRTTPVEPQGGP
jgi:hypothetical protein